jgi:3-oxoacyl-[acyl-carrier-protein] synthase-1
MQKVYITGSGVISSLGNNKKESIDTIKNITSDLDYKAYLKDSFRDLNFYSIKKKFLTQYEKFYSAIEMAVGEAILEAQISDEEIKDLHIFVGSTSMHISINEEANRAFLKGETQYKIKEIGYGSIGNFIEDLIDSRHKSTVIQSACTSSANAFSYAANLIKHTITYSGNSVFSDVSSCDSNGDISFILANVSSFILASIAFSVFSFSLVASNPVPIFSEPKL